MGEDATGFAFDNRLSAGVDIDLAVDVFQMCFYGSR